MVYLLFPFKLVQLLTQKLFSNTNYTTVFRLQSGITVLNYQKTLILFSHTSSMAGGMTL